MTLLFDQPAVPSVKIAGQDASFPLARIFCVGRNYEAHAKEMGFAADREAPIWFTKSNFAYCPSGATIPYPPGTQNCHFEAELVVVLGQHATDIAPEDAMDAVYGYAVGIDLTRRDLQNAAKAKGYPWDLGKDFENAAVIAPITPKEEFGELGNRPIELRQNGEARQHGGLGDLIWSVAELVSDLSTYYRLMPGDVIFTGTPAGVGPIAPGDLLEASVEGLMPLTLSIAAPLQPGGEA